MSLVDTIRNRLERSRKDLLDLSARNRLISTPRGPARSGRVEIIDELSEEVFRLLVTERKAMSFLARPGEDDEDENGADEGRPTLRLLQPEDEAVSENGVAERHLDARLRRNSPQRSCKSDYWPCSTTPARSERSRGSTSSTWLSDS